MGFLNRNRLFEFMTRVKRGVFAVTHCYVKGKGKFRLTTGHKILEGEWRNNIYLLFL